MLDRLARAAPYAVLLGVAAGLYAVAGRFEFSAPAGRIGPDAWPKLVLGLLAVVCLYEIVRSLSAGREISGLLQSLLEQAADGPAGEAPAGDAAEAGSWRRLATGIGVTILYVALIGVLGFTVATVLYLAAFMRAGNYRRYPVIATASVAGTAVLVFVFMRVVYVSLPAGIGPFATFSFAVLSLIGVK
ncbi:MAG: tripartite tricarboxylate transporter TctB family protein [Burkholderiales bacterium]|nr:tripartite tricarboxylate transporter TctB family protein [Burkholderiales bacterium]